MRKRWWIVALAAVVAIVVAGGAVWYFVFRDDAPAEVSIDRATSGINSGDSDTTATSGGNTKSSGVDGTWNVDQTIGSFNDFSNSFVGFRVQEQLVGIGAKTAVGRTPDVTGTMTILGTTVPNASFDVDMTTLTTDDGRRDNAIRTQAIETERFPKATFVLTQPISLGSIPADGAKIRVDASGDLTLHGVTKRITVPLEAERNGNVITVVGSLEIPFSDYSISQPRAASVLSVEDKGVFEVQLHFTRTT